MQTSRHTLRVAFLAACMSLGLIFATSQPVHAQTAGNPASTTANQGARSAPPSSAPPFTIELYSTKARFENDGTGERRLDVRIRVQSDAGAQALHSLSFDYNSDYETFSLAFLRIKKADGSVVEAKSDAVQDRPNAIAKNAPAFSNIREARVTVPTLADGDTLSYEVVIKTIKPMAPEEFWFAHFFLTNPRALDEELTVDVPAGRSVQLRPSPQFVPTIASQAARRIYSWKRTITESDLEHFASQKNSAASDKRESNTPDVMLSSFASWESAGKWLAAAMANAANPSAEVKAKAESLIANGQSDSDKLAAIYDFVAKQIRLVQLPLKSASFLPHDAAQVLKDGYGDEMDKCALLLALSDAIGHHGDVALETSDGKFDSAFAFPGDVAHSIVVFGTGKEPIWLNPSTPAAPFRYLTPNLRGKQALIASMATPPHIEETPVDPPFLSTQRVDITGRVNSLGKLLAHLRYTLRGDNEYALRMAFLSTPKDQWKQTAQTMAALDGLQGEVANVSPSDPTATHDPFVLNFDLVNPLFVDWSRKEFALALPLPTFGLPDAPADPAKPIHLGSPLDVTTDLTLTLPVTDSAQAPVGSGVSRDFAEYQSHYAANDRVITAQRNLRFLAHEVPASRAADYAAFVRAIQADEGQTVLVTNMVPEVPADAAPADVMEAGVAALKSQNYANALRLFLRVRELDPKQPGLWNDLGLAQLQFGQYENAVTSFQNQLAANPKDETAISLLGVALFDEKKYDEAAAAFQKQITFKPLDPSAYTYLGTVYIQQKKFQAAVAELEKAIVLGPDDAGIRLRLGEAYLGLGQTDPALAAFQKAAALSPTAPIENEIAFSLAQHSIALDRAQHYAESALESTESQLRDLDLGHLTQQQVAGVTFLAPIWDTLGWIYFREGKLEQAESFVRPAWLLDERGDVGAHLAEIYEARGEKTLAIRTYTLALATGGAPADSRARLAKLLGGESSIDARLKTAKPELLRMHALPLGRSPSAGKASFLLLLQRGPSGTVVRDVKFLGGTQALAPLGDRIKRIKFPELFPVGSKVGILLPGVASCSAKMTPCEFIFETTAQLLGRG
jgi:tetratricopeptide (TPR) repeat protein